MRCSPVAIPHIPLYSLAELTFNRFYLIPISVFRENTIPPGLAEI